MATFLKVGELAKRAGLTVRTLHHYDAIGLLSASHRTASGSRRYGRSDVIRLHRIQACKQLGWSLTEIRSALDNPALNPLEVIDRQILALDEQARQANRLSARLQDFRAQITSTDATATSDWLDILQIMAIYQSHLTEAEHKILLNPVGSGRRDIDAEWGKLVDLVETAICDGLPTDSKAAQEMSWRWVRLVIITTGNDATLAAKLMTIHSTDERAQDVGRIDPGKIRWISEAFAHARIHLFSKYLTQSQTDELRRKLISNLTYMTDWPLLVARVREQMDNGVPPDADSMLALATQWRQLFHNSYCGSDKALEAGVHLAFQQEPDLRVGVGIDDALVAYIQNAMANLSTQVQRNA